MENITAVADKIREFNNDDESGMEAAQVILILFLVVLGLIPIIITIKNRLAGKATQIDTSINGTT